MLYYVIQEVSAHICVNRKPLIFYIKVDWQKYKSSICADRGMASMTNDHQL